jgi:two-component system, OmpR family, KDP operon response regulator KdpE
MSEPDTEGRLLSENLVVRSNGPATKRPGDSLLFGRTVLAVDGELQMGQLLQSIFGQAGARVITAISGELGLDRLRDFKPDLVLVDLMMPDMDGLELCLRIRRESTVPIIVVTVASRATDIVRCLDAGADDFVAKPFNTQVLLARARAALRRTSPELMNRPLYDDGHVSVFAEEQRVVVRGRTVRLSNTEFKLLHYLVENAGQTCSFAQILSNVWGEEYRYNAEYVHVYIWRLRQKLEEDPGKPCYLKTVHSLGYRFVDGAQL